MNHPDTPAGDTPLRPAEDDALRRAIREASNWYARLHADAGSAALQAGWERWHGADPAHREAWRRVQAVHERFGQVPGAIAAPALAGLPAARRAVLRGLALLAAGGLGGGLAYRNLPWQAWRADYRSGVGERREIVLDDGSQLLLNTASAVDVAFDERRRLLRLRAGEILVATRPDTAAVARPFLVATRHGMVRALGTRFSVRLEDDRTVVSVLEAAVELQPADAPRRRLRLEAGRRAGFTAEGVEADRPDEALSSSWASGSLVVVDMPLGRLVDELGRYRPGILSCDPAVAQLSVSGAFPVDDTDRALAVLAEGFPVRIDSMTRYWVRVLPR